MIVLHRSRLPEATTAHSTNLHRAIARCLAIVVTRQQDQGRFFSLVKPTNNQPAHTPMSFVLRFFHAPHVTSVREAVTWADGRNSAAPIARNPHFARFVERITEFYPDLSDDDGDGDGHNLWPEGLVSDDHDGEVVNILINTDMFDEGVMSVIARHADEAGLRVLDEQNGLLFGPGLRYIEQHDATAKPLPEITPFAYSVMTENIRGLRFDHARQQIADHCRRALGRGFTIAEGRSAMVVRRDHGELRQMLSIRIMRSSDGLCARVYCRAGFSCEALAQQWMPLLPVEFAKRRANYDKTAGGTDFEFVWFVPDLATSTLPAELSLATSSRMRFADAAELKTLLSAIKPWASTTLLPFLDGVRGVDDLLPLFIHEASLRHARISPISFPIYPAMLALARRAGAQTLEEYAQAYRANADFRRLCTLFKDPAGTHFDALVEGLRR